MADFNTATWLIPFKGRSSSSAYDVNFVWRCGSVYIMDNHRAALWCWLQHMKSKRKHNMLHIDAHYDAVKIHDAARAGLPDLETASLEQYLSATYAPPQVDEALPIIAWDDYLSWMLHQFPHRVAGLWLATQHDGDKPTWSDIHEIAPWELPQNMGHWIESNPDPWLINVDLDYFVCPGARERRIEMMSEDFIRQLFSSMAAQRLAGRVVATTIALSPDTTGGWAVAEKLCRIACEALDVRFALPPPANGVGLS